MHIPDGYISPQTSLAFWGAILPIWSIAMKKIKNVMDMRILPSIGLCAAFSFIIMMFNVPIGSSTVHAVGAAFLSVLLGPWVSVICLSVTLIIQALIFG